MSREKALRLLGSLASVQMLSCTAAVADIDELRRFTDLLSGGMHMSAEHEQKRALREFVEARRKKGT